jgi:ATP-dependent HslUV protease subunit HslV
VISKSKNERVMAAGAGRGEASGHPLDLGEGRRVRSTTVICVRRGDSMVMAADGQVTLGSTVMKHSAKKIRRLYNDKILAGFAGSTADAFSLFTRFEAKLEQYGGNLGRSAVELAKDWRTDKLLRQLQALLIVADAKQMFLLSGELRSGGGDGVDGKHGDECAGDRGAEYEDCCGDLYLLEYKRDC